MIKKNSQATITTKSTHTHTHLDMVTRDTPSAHNSISNWSAVKSNAKCTVSNFYCIVVVDTFHNKRRYSRFNALKYVAIYILKLWVRASGCGVGWMDWSVWQWLINSNGWGERSEINKSKSDKMKCLFEFLWFCSGDKRNMLIRSFRMVFYDQSSHTRFLFSIFWIFEVFRQRSKNNRQNQKATCKRNRLIKSI